MFTITGINLNRSYLVSLLIALLAFALITYSLEIIPLAGTTSLADTSYTSVQHHSLLAFSLMGLLVFGVLVVHYCYLKKMVNKHHSIIKQLINQISDPVQIKDAASHVVFCNQAAADRFNCSAEDLIKKSDIELTSHNPSSNLDPKEVLRIIESGKPEEVSFSYTNSITEKLAHIRSVRIPFSDVTGQWKLLVIDKDITDLVELKQQADKHRTRLEHVLSVSNEGLWEWNAQTDEVVHNEKWQQICGLQHSQTSFSDYEKCILEEDKQKALEAVKLHFEENKPLDIKYRIRRPNGELAWIWDRGITAEFDENGNPLLLVGIAQDITQEKNYEQKLLNLAYYDQITGLTNRAEFINQLNITLQQNALVKNYSAVLHLDIDKFKLINEACGHQEGDKLLKEIANRLNRATGELGIVSRYDRDEFVMLLPSLDQNRSVALDQIDRYTNSLIAQVSQSYKVDDKSLNLEFNVTCSIGIVLFQGNNMSSEKLLNLTDSALNSAKKESGNSVKLFDEHIQQDLQNKVELQVQMKKAITNDEFTIFLQPQYNSNNQIIGSEALVRWQHPSKGILPPASFLNIAEENNLIVPIGNQVIRQACEQLQKWQADNNLAHMRISVNISAKQIWQNWFAEDLISLIDEYDIDQSKLTIEVTESLLIHDIEDAKQKLQKLKEYGLSIALDDFGTGYSSLSHLLNFPINEIKIDRSFVKNITDSESSRVMIRSIVDLANNFGAKVVCEGVEEAPQLAILSTLNLQLYQGYYFSKPLPINEFDTLLVNSQTPLGST